MTEDINIAQGGQVRLFIQKDGPSPANPFYYYGQIALDDTTVPLGTSEIILLPSSSQRNHWEIVGSTDGPPELSSTGFTHRMDRYLRDIWWDLKKKANCRFHMLAVLSNCARPDDPTDFDGIMVYKQTKFTDLTIPSFNPLDGDNAALDLTGSLQIENIDAFRRIRFAEKADTNLLAEALDGLYYGQVECGDCGAANDGCQKAYVLTAANGGSPGLSSQILHTSDGWATDQSLDINSLSGLSGDALAAMGLYLVVVSEADGAHHYALLGDVDDNTPDWTRVSTGYVAGGSPRAITALSPTLALIAGAGGYIYKLTDPTQGVTPVADGSATTQVLNAIHGKGQTIVAVGNSNVVLLSTNRGETFSLVAGPAAGVDITAVHVISDKIFWVGMDNGNLYFTVDAGDNWTVKTLASGISTVNDIWFVDDLVGYAVVEIGGAGVVFRTNDMGYTWRSTSPAVAGVPTVARFHFIHACDYNTVMCGGRVSAGGDGLLAVAE